MTTTFKAAPYSATAWIWTIVYILLTLYFAVPTVLLLSRGQLPDPVGGVATIVLVLLLVYSWIRSIRGYRLEGDQVVIDRAGPGKIHISVDNIEQVSANPDLGSFFNTSFLSMGGVFGWAGRVRVRRPSDLKSLDADVYGTNSGKTLLLEMKNGTKIILTPADPQAMETALHTAGVGPRQGRSTMGAGPRVSKSGRTK